jgi:hypothetical protein
MGTVVAAMILAACPKAVTDAVKKAQPDKPDGSFIEEE